MFLDFIKVGCHSASIEITLNNTGYLTYKPNEYGDQIIIYRSFTSNGNNSYKIKSATGNSLLFSFFNQT